MATKYEILGRNYNEKGWTVDKRPKTLIGLCFCLFICSIKYDSVRVYSMKP